MSLRISENLSLLKERCFSTMLNSSAKHPFGECGAEESLSMHTLGASVELFLIISWVKSRISCKKGGMTNDD